MGSYIYWVKENRLLFRKSNWNVRLDKLIISLHEDRQSALDEAIHEAERTSILGRQTEVWIDDGHGFTLHKAFQPSKPSKDDEEEQEGTEEGFSEDDNIAI